MEQTLASRSRVAAVVCLIAFAIYLPALKNDFINWDDGPYVYENMHIRTFDARLFA